MARKLKVVEQVYLGSLERIRGLATYSGKSRHKGWIEERTEDQAALLNAFGHKGAGVVLQKSTSMSWDSLNPRKRG